MNTTTIGQVLTLPDKSALDCVSGTVTEVYKARQVAGGKTAQDAKLRDSSGEIKLTVWDHPDIGVYKGKEVFIQAGPKGGLTVKFDGYQGRNVNTISISRGCTFQNLQVHQAQTGAPAQAASAAPTTPPPNQHSTIVVNGAKVGMALNNACQFLVAAGEPFSVERVHQIASDIVRLSNRMEIGELAEIKEEIPY